MLALTACAAAAERLGRTRTAMQLGICPIAPRQLDLLATLAADAAMELGLRVADFLFSETVVAGWRRSVRKLITLLSLRRLA